MRKGRKPLTLQEVKDRIFKIHGNTVTLIDDTYINTQKVATFLHSDRGPWRTKVSNVLHNRSSHPSLQIESVKLSISEVKEKLFNVHGDSVTIIESTYKDSHTKATFVHKDDGPWEAIPSNVFNQGTAHTKYKSVRYTQSEFEEKLRAVHGDTIKIIWNTFINIGTKASFIHTVYGEFIAKPIKVLRGKGHILDARERQKATTLKRYGFEFAIQNQEFALKVAKNCNKSTTLNHWKTGEELVCQGGYEPKVVNYLNSNKIDYLWQPRVFTTDVLTPKGNKSTYRPDLFLVESSTWVEIKGYFRGDALEKWNWFQSQHPNSELWDKKKLKSLGIL